VETEISGGLDLDGIKRIAMLGPDFVSVGRLTHSAPSADVSMRMKKA
jgi:nicotinate-nucleotide pyrophosphorylase (carboxylating)